MKHFLFVLLLLSSCTPTISWHDKQMAIATTINGKSLSCFNSQCCFPYKHHKDVKNVHVMVCSEQLPDKDGFHQLSVSTKMYFR